MLSAFVLGLAAILITVSVQAGTKMLTPRLPQKPFPITSKKTFTIKANEFYDKASQYGYNSYAHDKSWNAECVIIADNREHTGPFVTVRTGMNSNVIGSTCDYSLFEGTLINNFVFKDFTPRSSTIVSGKAETTMTKKPSPGSTSVNFKFHGWAEPFELTSMGIRYITLEGPANLTWDRAFH
jgi:hypothetical protein